MAKNLFPNRKARTPQGEAREEWPVLAEATPVILADDLAARITLSENPSNGDLRLGFRYWKPDDQGRWIPVRGAMGLSVGADLASAVIESLPQIAAGMKSLLPELLKRSGSDEKPATTSPGWSPVKTATPMPTAASAGKTTARRFS